MDIRSLRNIGIIAHIDAGKTTLTERILYYTGKEHRMGSVDEGTAKMDYLEEEQERGITITSAATTCRWLDHVINLIDTPGHVDFTAEVERSLRVLDGAIGVFCGVAGVEAQSETVWRQADRYHVPRLAFVNKLDRVGADFERAVTSLRERLRVKAVPLVIPVGRERDLEALIDLVHGELLRFPPEALGARLVREPIPPGLEGETARGRERLLEAVAEEVDAIAELYLANRPVPPEVLIAGLRKATLTFDIVPVFCGAALRNFGVQPLLDGVVRYLPSPLDVPPVTGVDPRRDREVVRKPDPREPLCALVFKTLHDAHGELSFLRLYSGTLTKGQQLYSPRRDKSERVTRLFLMHADERQAIEEAGPGQIVAVVGLHYSTTGDTLCPRQNPVLLEGMVFPETVVSMSIEPRATAQRDELEQALRLLARDDPTFAWQVNEETGQMIISGMGELHLEVITHRLVNDFKLEVRVGKPRVAYKQTIAAAATAEGVFDRLTGGRALFGKVRLRVEPSSGLAAKVRNAIDPSEIPRLYWPGVESAAAAAARSGLELGFPIINLAITLLGGEVREGEANEVALAAATELAFRQAMASGGVVLVEPVMRFEIRCPEEYVGGVISDLNVRRARILEFDPQAQPAVVRGTVPLAETFGYTTQLRSLTQGRASASLEPFDYEPVPDAIAQRLFR
ncbi:MAG: elongation factor G [Planctomycetota bacterium]